MKVAILLYEGFTTLDATGPFDVLSRLPGAQVEFASRDGGVCHADARALGVVTSRCEAVEAADVLVVPGGSATQRYLRDDALLDWIRRIDAGSQWTTSVCTGSLLLGAAGLLEGRRATSHWYELESLRCFGAEPVSERVVEDGKVMTAAGVSAGIDMALTLMAKIAGEDYSRAVHLAMEYAPEPPYDCGTVATAPAALVSSLTDLMRAGYGPAWAERQAAMS